MLICILGFSASGKDTIEKEMINKYSFNKVIQFTNRPPRENEINGIDYHFVSNQEFKSLILKNEFVSYRKFNSILGTWYYGISKNGFSLSDKNILIVDIDGLLDIKKNYTESNCLSIFIDVDYNTRLQRVKNRPNSDLQEFERRAKDDESKRDFLMMNCDYVVKNKNFKDCMFEIEVLLKKTPSP